MTESLYQSKEPVRFFCISELPHLRSLQCCHWPFSPFGTTFPCSHSLLPFFLYAFLPVCLLMHGLLNHTVVQTQISSSLLPLSSCVQVYVAETSWLNYIIRCCVVCFFFFKYIKNSWTVEE